jgi:hypothetical protein
MIAPAPKKADTLYDVPRDARAVVVRVYSNGKNGEQGGTNGDQDDGSKSRSFNPKFALRADQGSHEH